MRSALTSLSLLSLLLVSARARALPALGSPLPALQVKAADGAPQQLPTPGRAALIIYESRGSRPQNYPLKKRLKLLALANDEYRVKLTLVPIANLQSYDFWPMKGIAASAVRSESKRVGTAIYCDWNGTVGKLLGVRPELSSVILVSHTGAILFAAEGPLGEEAQERLLALLKAELP